MMRKHSVLLRLLPVLIVLIPQISSGQSRGSATPIRAVIGTGGGTAATDGEWSLQGTVGQSTVGMTFFGEVELSHGFWFPIERTTSQITINSEVASSEAALQNFPNPFSLSTEIRYSVTEQSLVNLSIYDMSGRLVRPLVNEELQPGSYKNNWNGEDASGDLGATGFYLCLLKISPSGSTAQATEYREIISFVR
ncbi:MAG: FlgD immunoglobulin-like domain containing protein [Candidatus Kapaibacterium sp.]